MPDSQLDSDPLDPPYEPPYDTLMAELDQRGYSTSARLICTRLCLAEFDSTGPLSQRSIADRTGLNVATVREQLGALEDDGYVAHHRNSDDPREKLYRLVSLDIHE